MVPVMAPFGAFECPSLLKPMTVAFRRDRTKKTGWFSHHPVIPLSVSSRFSQHLLQANEHSFMVHADTQRRQRHSSGKEAPRHQAKPSAAITEANCFGIGDAFGDDLVHTTIERLAFLLDSAEPQGDCCQ